MARLDHEGSLWLRGEAVPVQGEGVFPTIVECDD